MADFLIYNGSKNQYAERFNEYKMLLAEYERRHECFEVAVALLNRPMPPSKVEVVPGEGYLLHVYSLYSCYEVPLIKSYKSLVGWILRLSPNTWFDGDLCHDLISAVCYVNKWNRPY